MHPQTPEVVLRVKLIEITPMLRAGMLVSAVINRTIARCRVTSPWNDAYILLQAVSALVVVLLLICAGPARAQIDPSRLSVNISNFGPPLPGVSRNHSDYTLFVAGQNVFTTSFNLPVLGPLFNNRTCVACHFQPAIGGNGEFITEFHARHSPSALPVHTFAVDNMLRAGIQNQAGVTVFPQGVTAAPLGCQIGSPGCQLSPCQQQEAALTTFSPSLPICDPTSQAFVSGGNCSGERSALALFGDGLVEAVDDQTIIALANTEPASVRGTVRMLDELGRTRVARFGWKEESATLRGFAALATANEIGLTTPDSPEENTTCALNVTQFGVVLDSGQEPEDRIDSTGRAEIDRMVDFIRALAPPAPLPENSLARRGHHLFDKIGCSGCHAETMKTASNPASFIPTTTGGVPISASLNRTLARQTFHPFSDFLLHDMGSLGDGITSGEAGPTMIRTVPLWGLRAKVRFLHDGRADDLPTAIGLHDGQARDAAQAFAALGAQAQAAIISFLDTL